MEVGRVGRRFRQIQGRFLSTLKQTIADRPSIHAYQQMMMREAPVTAVVGARPQLNVAPVQARQSSRITIESPSVNAAKKNATNAGVAGGDSPSTPTDSGDEKPCTNEISIHMEADLSPAKSKL